MINIREELASLICSLNIEKFRILVQNFLKEKYSTLEVFIVDGPYDGGNDLEIRFQERTIKRNIQITVQKSDLDTKLKADLEKANQNKKKYNYLNKLDFYYNQRLTKEKINELILLAEINYEIDLIIYDGNILAQLNENYPVIKKTTLELLDIKPNEEFIPIDKQTKILFDLLAIGNEAGEVKKQFIFSFIFTYLFENPSSAIDEIMNYVSEKLPDITGIKFFRDALSLLKGKGAISTDESKKFFSLSEEKRKEITIIYDKALLQESVLKELLHNILAKSNLENESNEIASFLYDAYKENYKIDLEELTQNSLSINSSIKKIYQELQRFLQTKKLTSDEAKQLTSEILEGCNKNEYLNKIGASVLFANLYKSNKLDDYLNQKNQHYYFDTQVLLQLICYQYENSDYDDVAFLSVKNLYETCKDFKRKVVLNTSYDYLTEVAGHIQEALKLQRFLSLPIFEKFRTSKNVFFNYYIHLQKIGKIEEDLTLEEFIDNLLDIETPEFNDPDFIYIVGTRLKAILEVLNINIIYHKTYEHFTQLKKEYEITLSYLDKRRSNSARENDVRMIIYLADINRHVGEFGLRTEPFLVTWDKVFYEYRKVLMSKYKLFGYSYWYIYSPAKLADKLSVMNYKLNPESIDYNIISLTESNFNISMKGYTFLDTISLFFNKEDVSELKLANKLLDLEERTRKINDGPIKEDISEAITPLVDILIDLRSYYSKPESNFEFNDLVSLFEYDKFESKVYKTLEKTIEIYLTNNKKIEKNLYDSFDSLIEELKYENTNQITRLPSKK